MKYHLLLLLLLSSLTYSQGIPKPPLSENIQSPNASSLGRYGDVPVSLYTGTPEIGIPIQIINEGDITLDINLQYDASGVRINSVPGWVGQNWSLNAGGIITRTMRGRSVDEFDITRGLTASELGSNPCSTLNWPNAGCETIWNQGYKNNLRYLNTSDWSSTHDMDSIRVSSIFDPFNYSQKGISFLEGHKNWQPDLEPDIFTFNFMGHTGKFFLGQDGQWKVSSSSNLKVICNFSQNLVTPIITPQTANEFSRFYPRVINSITLIDDSGNRFNFGNGGAYELTFPDFFDQKRNPVTTSAWYLQSVYNKSGIQIYTFEYEKGPYIGHFYLNWGAKLLDYSGFSNQESNATAYNVWSNTWDSSSIKAPGQLILPIYLKKITTKSGLIIEFNSSISNALKFKTTDNPLINPNRWDYNNNTYWDYDWRYFIDRKPDFSTLNSDILTNQNILNMLKWKKLDNISIKDKNEKTLMSFNLNYVNVPERRLFLKDIILNTDKKYSFEYYNDELLPNFLSNSIDHLGYYNGHPFSYTASPNAFTFWRNFYNQRESNAEYVKYGSLKKIIYPTKGFTEFEFEAHSYSKEVDKNGILLNKDTDGIIGGLRIKKILNNDGKGNNYIKEYQYKNDINSQRSSGNLLFKPTYIAENIYLPHGSSSQPYFQQYTMKEISINSLIPLTNLMGNTIEYESVIEKNSYFNDTQIIANINGYSISKFSNYVLFPDYPPVNSLAPDYNFNFPKTDRSFERGKITERATYDILNNIKTKNTYLYQSNQNLKVNAMKMYIFDIACTNCQSAVNENLMSAYQIFYSDKYLIEEKEELFNSTGTIINSNKYSYRRYPESAGTIQNFGDLFKSSEYHENNEGGFLTTYKYPFDYVDIINTNMYNSRIIPPIYQKKELVTGDPYEPNKVTLISEQKIDYLQMENGYGDLIQLPQSVLYKKGSNSFETRFKYLNYSYEGILQEYKTENGIVNCLIWGYNQTQPIAKIENATYASINSSLILAIQNASNTGTEANLLLALTNLRNSLPNAMITTYTYIPLVGISSITDTKGDTTTYNYDKFGRLQNIKDKNGNILSENEYHYKN